MDISRKIFLASATALAATAMASSALAQASASTSATASITIFQPITIIKTSDLQFGRVIRPDNATPTVYAINASTGAATATGGTGIFSGAVTPTRAAFTVNGEGGQAFNITSDATVTDGGVTINLVKSGATGALDGAIGSSGTASFGVGGNVTLDNSSPTGVKSGSFNVTVTYQ